MPGNQFSFPKHYATSRSTTTRTLNTSVQRSFALIGAVSLLPIALLAFTTAGWHCQPRHSSPPQQPEGVWLQGQLEGFNQPALTVYQWQGGHSTLIDTFHITNPSSFSVFIPLKDTAILMLYHQYPLPIVAVPGDTLWIHWNLSLPYAYEIRGNTAATQLNRALQEVTRLRQALTGERNPFLQALTLRSLPPESPLFRQYTQMLRQIIIRCQNPACLYFLYEFLTYEQLPVLTALIDSLHATQPELFQGFLWSDLQTRYQKLKQSAVGSPAPPITIHNPEGQILSLYALRGKVVLLDFWASWCLPCRITARQLRTLYRKYAPLGFEIFSISLDTSRQRWLRAIQEDSLFLWRWHGCDFQGWESPILRQYNIQSIPYAILIDREGIIRARGLPPLQMDSLIRALLQQ